MTKPYARPRGTLIAAIDIGTTKVCCFIARREPTGPRILGIGHQVSRGVRAGQINDLDAAATSMLNAVHAAEQMAGETITEVILNLSGGFPPSRIVPVEMALGGREIGDAEKPGFLSGAKALLMPIDWPEPFGLVMIEAMACGTPVVAWQRGAVPEVMEEGRTGFVVDSIDEAVAAVARAAELDRATCRRVFLSATRTVTLTWKARRP